MCSSLCITYNALTTYIYCKSIFTQIQIASTTIYMTSIIIMSDIFILKEANQSATIKLSILSELRIVNFVLELDVFSNSAASRTVDTFNVPVLLASI